MTRDRRRRRIGSQHRSLDPFFADQSLLRHRRDRHVAQGARDLYQPFLHRYSTRLGFEIAHDGLGEGSGALALAVPGGSEHQGFKRNGFFLVKFFGAGLRRLPDELARAIREVNRARDAVEAGAIGRSLALRGIV